MAQFFNNETIIAPQTVVAIDDTAIGPTSTASTQLNVGIVGLSTQGQPDVPILITSVDQALAVFGQGNLVDGIRRAFAPAAGGGTQQVYGVRLNPATQGELDLLDSNSDVAIHLTTRDYGVFTRGFSVRVAAATGAGSNFVPTGALKITVTSSGNPPNTVDNLGYNALNVESLNASGTVTVAKSTATIGTGYSAGQVATVVVDTGGSGYTTPPTVTFSAPQTAGGVLATGTAVLTGDAVTSVTITAAGSGYTSAPTVTLTGGGGSGATAHSTVGPPQTSIVVATSATGQHVHQLVGQQVTIANSDGTKPFNTLVTAESGGTITVSPGDVFTRTNTATVKGVSVALLLLSAATADKAGLPLTNYGTLKDLALAASSVGTTGNWLVSVPSRMNPAPLAIATTGPLASPTILDVGQSRSVTQTTDPNNPQITVMTGIAQAVVDWLNGRGEIYFTAERFNVDYPLGTIPAVTAAKFATGGADDGSGGSLLSGVPLTISNSDWSNALTALSSVDTPLFVLMSGDPSVIALGDAHAATMSGRGRLERIQIAGLDLGKSTDDAIDAASALDSFRTYLVYPGIRDFDVNGNLVTLPPYYAAAQVAGLAAGLGENVALTGKAIRIQGLEVRTQGNGGPFGPDDVDALLLAGVIPIAFRPGKGFIVVQSISTWQDDVRYSKREMSVRRVVDRLARAVREALDNMVGTGITPAFLNAVGGVTKTVLEDYSSRGYIVGDSNNPPYQGITVSQQQGRPDTVLVSFEASPGVPANYILVTAHLTAFGS